MSPTASPKKTTFTASDVDKGKKFLSQLPKVEKPKAQRKMYVADLIADLRTEIRAAVRRGHTLEEIVDGLNRTHGWDLRVASVRSYLNRRKRTATKNNASKA